MRHTKRSLILFSTLTTLVVFFIGLNLGKYIERLNKTYPVQVVPTPSAAQQDTIPSPISKPATPVSFFEPFIHKGCGVSFLVPSTFVDKPSESLEAELIDGKARIFVTCQDSFILDQERLLVKTESTSSATLASQKVTVYKTTETDIWIIRNKQRRQVLFETTHGVTPLIQQTLELQ